jgi:hypothetical protein
VNCRQVQEDVASVLLTGSILDPDAIRHVAMCPACAAEQASLVQVVTLMATVPGEDVAGERPAPVDRILLQRILEAVAQERARDRRRAVVSRGLAVAAAVVIVVLGVAAATGLLTSETQVIRASATAAGILATADIVASGDGSALDISITGMPADTDCVLRVVTADGRTQPIAEWRAEYDGTAHVAGTASVAPGDITHVTISEPDGSVLLDIPVAA